MYFIMDDFYDGEDFIYFQIFFSTEKNLWILCFLFCVRNIGNTYVGEMLCML